MNIQSYVEQALARDNRALNEYESKQVLRAVGLPLPEEVWVPSPQDALAAARRMGFPVVLKGVGHRIPHKSERGLVHIGLPDEAALQGALDQTARSGGADLEGFLIQTPIPGRREFMAGVYRDAQFGPVVMFGLGGVYTEALSDTSCRLAPLSSFDADQMIDDLRAQGLLGAVRGEAAVNRHDLAAILLGLSRLVSEYPDLAEIDLNPLIAQPDGRIAIADALVVCQPRSAAAVKTNGVAAPIKAMARG